MNDVSGADLQGQSAEREAELRHIVKEYSSPIATGCFGGLNPRKQNSNPSNWNTKHCKSVEFLSNLNVKHPLHERESLPHKRKVPYNDFLATVPEYREVTTVW